MALVNALVTSSDCKIQVIGSYTEPDNGPHSVPQVPKL